MSHFGFTVLAQRGSHVEFRRLGLQGRKETMVAPLRNELDLGTLHAIYRKAALYVSKEDLLEYFYTD